MVPMRSTTAIDRLPLHYENPEQTAELFGLDRTLKQFMPDENLADYG